MRMHIGALQFRAIGFCLHLLRIGLRLKDSDNVEDGFKLCLKSLCEQNHKNYEVHLNFSPVIVHDDWLNEYRFLFDIIKSLTLGFFNRNINIYL